MTNVHHPRFELFLTKVERLISSSNSTSSEEQILREGGLALAELLQNDDWLPQQFAEPHPDHYTQYLLHADEADRFSVVSFVWGPGQRTPVHNHTVWGIVGVLRGAERSRGYVQQGDGTIVPLGEEELLQQGHVETVSPTVGDLHTVANAYDDRNSISIHIYGANIGKVKRSIFQLDGTAKDFVSGYANA